jgi:hypothetical protein
MSYTAGFYEDMTMEEYLRDPCPEPSLSSGMAGALLRDCPAKAFLSHPRLNGSYEEENDDKFDLGSATHALLLEGEDLARVIDSDSYRTKEARAKRDQARADGKIPLLAEQYETVQWMLIAAKAQLVESELHIENLQKEGAAETTIIWQDLDGTWCRIRPDWLSYDRVVTISYKTTAKSANPKVIDRMVESMGWDMAAAFYLRGIEAVLQTVPAYVYMVQEVVAPYLCSFVGLTPQYLDLGKQKVQRAIEIWAECTKSGVWPGYPKKVAYVEPKPWAIAQWEEQRFTAQLGEQLDSTEDGMPF